MFLFLVIFGSSDAFYILDAQGDHQAFFNSIRNLIFDAKTQNITNHKYLLKLSTSLEYCRSKVSPIILKIRNLNTVTPRGHFSLFYANFLPEFQKIEQKNT